MRLAARTLSQLTLHVVIAVSVVYLCTGSLILGGAMALLEPVMNVALMPWHQRCWRRSGKNGLWLERLSQFLLHLTIAFGLMWSLTGSIVWGGIAALLEPAINVLLLPLHDRWWQPRISLNA